MSSVVDLRHAHWRRMLQEGVDIIQWAHDVPCRLAWPCYDNGQPVEARDVLYWLRRRKLLWTCRCIASNIHGRAIAVFVVDMRARNVSVVCGGTGSAHCDFKYLTHIHSVSHFRDEYFLLREGQTESEYAAAVERGGNLILNMAPGIAGLEGSYEGWCGYYDGSVQQPGVALAA